MSHSSTFSSSQLLQIGMKKCVSNYTTKLKDEKYWFNYNQSLRTQARTFTISNVLDPGYATATLDEHKVLIAQKSFIFNVFQSNLHTAKIKKHIQLNVERIDGQAAHRGLLKEYGHGVVIDISIEKLK